MNTGQFPISLHILTLLCHSKGELLASEYIAGSININPVLVRKEISNLRKHGLIETKEGKNGGSYLTRPADKIVLSEVYKAVKTNSFLGQSKNSPNPDCPIGKQINQHLDGLYNEAENALIANLEGVTLADFCAKFS